MAAVMPLPHRGPPEDGLLQWGTGKISPDGFTLKRYYQHIPSQRTRHYINDHTYTRRRLHHGKRSALSTVNRPRQQGWLLSVDSVAAWCRAVSW